MTDQQCRGLVTILMTAYHHNDRLHAMERAGKGLVRRGGHDRVLNLEGLEVHLIDDVLDVLQVPEDEEIRKKCHTKLFRAGSKFEPEVAVRIRKALYEIEAAVPGWRSKNN